MSIGQKKSEVIVSCSKSKRQLTPKVTLTKTTIVKSTPFLISRHHLDDTEMKQALRYPQTEQTQRLPRTYSYKAEKLTCQNSKYISQLQPHKSSAALDYYALQPSASNPDQPKAEQHMRQNRTVLEEGPYFKAGRSRVHSYLEEEQKQHKELTERIAKDSQEGLREMERARKKIQKESKKLRKLFKKKVEEDLAENCFRDKEVADLEQEVRGLKIKALEMERAKLDQQLILNVKKRGEESGQLGPTQKETLKYKLSQLVLEKPKYRPRGSLGGDTDSSFSSFEFQPPHRPH